MEAQLPKISARQIPQQRPAIEAELVTSGKWQVDDHVFLYGFRRLLF
jgi:hypothetical protein